MPAAPRTQMCRSSAGFATLRSADCCLGGLFGLARAVMLHVPAGLTGMIVLRLAIAGAAAGGSIPPAFRALSTMFRAFLWIVLATGLWMIALAAAGQWDWLNRLH